MPNWPRCSSALGASRSAPSTTRSRATKRFARRRDRLGRLRRSRARVKKTGYDVTVPFSPGRTDASQDQPDVGSFDIARDPNPHVAFGGSDARTSASAHLVCSEIRTMFAELTTRFPRRRDHRTTVVPRVAPSRKSRSRCGTCPSGWRLRPPRHRHLRRVTVGDALSEACRRPSPEGRGHPCARSTE